MDSLAAQTGQTDPDEGGIWMGQVAGMDRRMYMSDLIWSGLGNAHSLTYDLSFSWECLSL